MSKKAIIKDWITDGIGLAIWVVVIYQLSCKGIDFWPDACIGFVIGGLMFYVPDEWVTSHLKAWIKSKFNIK